MKDFKLWVNLKVAPNDLYAALTNKKIIEIWTGESAEMSIIPGSEFSWFDGDICGKNVEFVENRKIVQHWYFGDNEPSLVTILIHNKQKNVELEIKQLGIPDEDFDNISDGWKNVIIPSLRELLEE
jgi:activator of HSP90 ATPase